MYVSDGTRVSEVCTVLQDTCTDDNAECLAGLCACLPGYTWNGLICGTFNNTLIRFHNYCVVNLHAFLITGVNHNYYHMVIRNWVVRTFVPLTVVGLKSCRISRILLCEEDGRYLARLLNVAVSTPVPTGARNDAWWDTWGFPLPVKAWQVVIRPLQCCDFKS